MTYQPGLWHDYFVMVGGGSAALTGLVFVAMTLHLQEIVSDPVQRHRSRTILAGLTAVFIRCALVLMGGQNAQAIAVEIFGVLVVVEWLLYTSIRQAARSADQGVLWRNFACLVFEQTGSSVPWELVGALYGRDRNDVLGSSSWLPAPRCSWLASVRRRLPMSGLHPEAAPAMTTENGIAESAQNSALMQALGAEFSIQLAALSFTRHRSIRSACATCCQRKRHIPGGRGWRAGARNCVSDAPVEDVDARGESDADVSLRL